MIKLIECKNLEEAARLHHMFNNDKVREAKVFGHVVEFKVSERESDYDKGMRGAMKKIANSCGKTFAVDVGYEDLPDLVDSLIAKPKPRTKVEYERNVDVDLFGLHDEWKNMKLYRLDDNGDYVVISCMKHLANEYANGEIYRKVEKEIDKREEAAIHIHGVANGAFFSKKKMTIPSDCGWDHADEHVKRMWLSVVDLTGYRKPE